MDSIRRDRIAMKDKSIKDEPQALHAADWPLKLGAAENFRLPPLRKGLDLFYQKRLPANKAHDSLFRGLLEKEVEINLCPLDARQVFPLDGIMNSLTDDSEFNSNLCR